VTDFVKPLRDFVLQVHLDEGEELTEDTPLLEWAILDSFTLVELLQYVEDQFDIAVPNQEVTPENFGSLRRIDALLNRLEAEQHAK
jgi:acyl carrier protein